jgi:hypothetical protein
MQRIQDKFHVTNRQVTRKWTAAALAINAVILLTLVGLAAGFPGAAKWLSAAVQAESTCAVAPYRTIGPDRATSEENANGWSQQKRHQSH